MAEENDDSKAPVDFVLIQALLQKLIRIHCDSSHAALIHCMSFVVVAQSLMA